MAIYKNQSKTVTFQVITTAGGAYTGSAPTTTVSLDGGSLVATTNTASSLGSGAWKILLTAAEMNADVVTLVAVAGGCVPAQRELYTEASYTSTRAANLDSLPGVGPGLNGGLPVLDTNLGVKLSAYATGQDPATLVLATPANKLSTDASGKVQLQANQAVNVTQWNSAAVAVPNTTGVPKVDVILVNGGTATTATGSVDANVVSWSGTNVVTPDTPGHPKVTVKSGTGPGELSLTSGKVNAGFNVGA